MPRYRFQLLSCVFLMSWAVAGLANAQDYFATTASYGKGDGAGGMIGDMGENGGAGLGEDLLATGETFGTSPLSLAPGFIGDLINSSPAFGSDSSSGAGTIPIAGGDRRFKIFENVSPIPTDRVFFTFNQFTHAVRGNDGRTRDLQRYTFGAEKTFNNGMWSIEARVPFADGLDNVQRETIAFEAVEFGNIPLVFKSILWQNPCAVISGGASVALPTASDARLFDDSGSTEQIRVENEIVYIQPFLGFLYTPHDRMFVQGLIQADFSAGQNTVHDTSGVAGELADQHLLYIGASGGFWVYENPCARYVTGIAPMAEIHYTTAMNDADFVTANGDPIGNFSNRFDLLNITGALHTRIGSWSSLRVFASAPLKDGDDRQYDSEVGLQFNRRF